MSNTTRRYKVLYRGDKRVVCGDMLARNTSPKSQISLVFPVYNEQEVIPMLMQRIQETRISLLDDTSLLVSSIEVIFVDDGSKDASYSLLEGYQKSCDWVRVLSFSRNFGHQTAVTAGVDFAKGDAIVVMDADLQDPPEILPEMIRLWRQGNQVVYCVRRNRKESIIKVFCYNTFYRLLKSVADMDIPLDSGDFGLMDRRVVNVLKSMPERNRFMRGLRAWTGFQQISLEYDRAEREAGSSKYDLKRLLKLALDGIFSFSTMPLQVAGSLGVIVAAVGVIYAIKVLVWRILWKDVVPGFATLAILILIIGAIQLLSLYFIGTYIGRVYDESKQRPLYIIKNQLGFVRNRSKVLRRSTSPRVEYVELPVNAADSEFDGDVPRTDY